VKLKVSSSNEVPFTVSSLAMNIQTASHFECCAIQMNSAGLDLYEFDGANIVGSSTATYTLANDTWYTLELESSGLAFAARLKSATGDGTSAIDQPVYFEDFSLSAWQ
jgi:hypothetical protein